MIIILFCICRIPSLLRSQEGQTNQNIEIDIQLILIKQWRNTISN